MPLVKNEILSIVVSEFRLAIRFSKENTGDGRINNFLTNA